MFYKLDSTRVTLKEYWWGTPNPLVIFGWIAKWLRIRLPGSVDDPNVEWLEPFRVAPDALPEEVRDKFRPVHDELAAAGFRSPECYWIHDVLHQTDIYQAVYRHDTGQACARIHQRVWTMPKPPREYFFTTFVTPFTDGTYLVSTAGKADMLAPPSCRVLRRVGAPAGRLWEAHRAQLQEEQLAKTVAPIRDAEELVEAVETHHGAVRDFHVQRGVFVPMTPEEEEPALAAASPAAESAGEAEGTASQNAAVLAEIDRLQKKSPNWRNTILILAVSVALFVALGAARWAWEFILLLLPVLFLHESGHYLAMRLFHYRNVRMFFIPLFGAAVSGHHYNVAGWKKVIVSLAGPLPGILLADVLGAVGLIFGIELLVKAALLTLIVNGFNLLPVLPLDGGWAMHSLYFSRHYVLDAGFRVLAVLVLLVGSTLAGDRILFFLGLFMAIGLPAAFRMARVVGTLRRREIRAASPDAQSIPSETADAIIDEVRASFPQAMTNKNLALVTTQVFEALNARPPGWLATVALSGLHLGSFLFALVSVMIFVVGQHANLGDFVAAAITSPKLPVDNASIEIHRGAHPADVPAAEKTIVATFADRDQAATAFARLSGRVPKQATLARFGQSLLLAIDAGDDDACRTWTERLKSETDDVHVSGDNAVAVLTVTAIAPSEESAERIEKALDAYFAADPSMALVPPWHPDLLVSPQQERARQMYARLVSMKEVYNAPEVTRLRGEMEKTLSDRDAKQAVKLAVELRTVQNRLQEEHLAKLVAEARDPAERELVQLYQERPQFVAAADPADDEEKAEAGPAPDESAARKRAEEFQRKYATWCRSMGELMGQLPLDGETLTAVQRRYSATGGGVTRTGLIVQADYLVFDRLVDGPAALVRWLSKQNCVGSKYQFSSD